MKKKEILIILATILLIAVTILIIFYSRVKKIEYNPSILGGTYQPEFMNEEEKASFDLPTDSKIQVLKRNDEGEVSIYKIIREEIDVIYDIDAVDSPIDPRY